MSLNEVHRDGETNSASCKSDLAEQLLSSTIGSMSMLEARVILEMFGEITHTRREAGRE